LREDFHVSRGTYPYKCQIVQEYVPRGTYKSSIPELQLINDYI